MSDVQTKLRFIDGVLQGDSAEPGLPGQTQIDLVFVDGLLDHVETRAMGV